MTTLPRLLSLVVLGTVAVACGGSAATAPAATTAATVEQATTVAAATTSQAPTTTTIAPTTTPAPTTTLAPTGSVQSCEALRTFDDPDGDGWGECIVSMDNARAQYLFISGTYNGVVVPMGTTLSARECPVFLAAEQTFIDDMKAATWPSAVQTQLTEFISASEYDLFVRDDKCRISDPAVANDSSVRLTAAIFAWRQSIGAPTDI